MAGNRIRRGILTTLVLVASIAATQVVAAPAYAHDRTESVLHPVWLYFAGDGGVTNNHMRVFASDRVADGLGVMTYYRYRHPGGFIATSVVGDPDGSGPAVGADWPPGAVTQFQVCLQPYTNGYCTRWFDA
ncbi:hypothetical protein [Virgisporangium aurantiacum]|uniref:Uncharacterized protein n=1 Tax=Virgisporangium aurantiacum TaxID=175570 RepID=A0A8J4E5P0_9ACTN|nr:hypothetical protein [Virgisporangium aurantiacum]GIJ62319.1 hypothetical protein Vau01_098350 [Virgisporangium aurantiacum]